MEMNREQILKDVAGFKSLFAEDASAIAEKSIQLTKEGAVGIISFDQYQEKANKLSFMNMIRFVELLFKVNEDKSIKSLLIISKKPTIFIAGADIAEIKLLTSGKIKVESLMKLQEVFTYLEELPIPSVAAIHGACMGGGMELALGCDYRIASEAHETRMGLPEVMLGIIPGWGGTQRMPRLIGLEKSLDLILTGKNVDARKAKKIGLVDRTCPAALLESKAMAFAQELAVSGKKRPSPHRDFKEKLLETVPGGQWLVFDMARKQVMAKTKGNYPAPLKAIEAIKQGYGKSIEKGLQIEAKAFGELIATPECQNLLHVYYLNERVKRDKGVASGAKGKTIASAAVIGAGVMGGGIAQLFAAKKVRVRMKDINWAAIASGYKAAYRVFKKGLDRKKLKKFDVDNAMAEIEGTTAWEGFSRVDLVVEAVVEKLDVKKAIFKELSERVSGATILASNTSSLSVTEMALVVKNPERVGGMHFFNPVDKMPLVEVIRAEKTSDETVATIFQFSKKMGKTPIVVKDAPGFVVNRILGPYLNEAGYLMTDGVAPKKIDQVLEKFGMPMGPCTLLDEVGLDVGSKVAQVLFGAFGERMKPPVLIDAVVKAGRLGKKTGKGIYLHEGKEVKEDAEFLATLNIKAKDKLPSNDEIEKRCVFVMINEAARLLEEGVARDAADIDIGMIFGTGFAPFRGGLLKYADSLGAAKVVSELDLLARVHGVRFQPCQFLQTMAVSEKKFYDGVEIG